MMAVALLYSSWNYRRIGEYCSRLPCRGSVNARFNARPMRAECLTPYRASISSQRSLECRGSLERPPSIAREEKSVCCRTSPPPFFLNSLAFVPAMKSPTVAWDQEPPNPDPTGNRSAKLVYDGGGRGARTPRGGLQQAAPIRPPCLDLYPLPAYKLVRTP